MAVRSICLAGIEKSTDFQLGGALIVTPLGVFRLGVREGIDIGQGVKTFCNGFLGKLEDEWHKDISVYQENNRAVQLGLLFSVD